MQRSIMPDEATIISDNWQRVQESVARSLDSSEHNQSVKIVGVSKYVSAERTQLLLDSGCTHLGENRPQLIWEKQAWLEEHQHDKPKWHMIGHLQRNKVRRTLPMLCSIHSVDSERLATSVNEEAEKLGRSIPILAEVNVTEDTSKTGMQSEQLLSFMDHVGKLPNLQLQGLMAMSTHFAGGDQARREFAHVRDLRDRLQTSYPSFDLKELSMGMSGDFHEAILEGATLVRIGSSLWEGIER
ncbi:MAG: YggS family pyridoxal phosphate-dependent enzyme [Planctomycetota bacterium]